MHRLPPITDLLRRLRVLNAPAMVRVADDATSRPPDDGSWREAREVGVNMPAVVFEFVRTADGQFGFPYIGSTLLELTGVPQQDAGDRADELLSTVLPEDRPGMYAAIATSAETLAPFRRELRIRHARSGEIRWLKCESIPHRRDDGAVMWQGLLSDITEQQHLHAELARVRADAELMSSQINRALVESGARFDAIMEHAPVSIWAKDLNGVFLFGNDEFRRMLRAGDVPIAGCTDEAFVSPESARAFRRKDRDVIESGRSERFTETGVGVDGAVSHFVTVKFPLFGEDGRAYAAGGMCLDVTEQVEVHERLRRLNDELEERVAHRTAETVAAQRRIQDIVEAVLGVVFQAEVRNGETRCTFFSGRLQHDLGLHVDMPDIARRFLDMLEPLESERFLARRATALETMTAFACEFSVRLADGSIRWLHYEAAPRRNGDDCILINGYISDISETRRALKNAEEATRDTEAERARLFDITDALPGAVFQLMRGDDGEFSYPFFSKGSLRLIGLRNGEVMANFAAASACVLEEDREEFAALLERCADERSGFQHSFRVRDALTGELRWLQANAAVAVRDGGIVIWNGFVSDVTAHKRTQEQLAEARLQAEAANHAKSDFLANMSHEIRTPMNAILGMSHLLLQGDLDTRQRDRVGKIDKAARSLLGIIDDVLDFSKISAGKLVLERLQFPLREMLDDVAMLIAQRAEEKRLQLSFDIDTALPDALLGDPLRLSQILTNFCANAVKFTERGEIVIGASLLAGANDGVIVRFAVSDTGIGIDAVDLSRMFSAFEQADTSTTRRHGGTGLGLSICQQLAALMGGDIGVESSLGVGSTFWFSVPLGVAAPDSRHEDDERSSVGSLMTSRRIPPSARDRDEHGRSASQRLGPAARQADAARVRLRGARVLLVEDNPVNAEIVDEVLTRKGAVVATASDGRKALELLRTQPFDVVLMDMQMPVMDGASATRAARRIPELRALPIIALTANVMADDIQRCHEAGMNDHIGKPLDINVLVNKLAYWLDVGARGVATAVGDPSAERIAASPLAASAVPSFLADDTLRERLRELSRRIDEDDTDARDILDGIAPHIAGAAAKPMRALEYAMANYDFGCARHQLMRLVDALGVSL